MHLFYTDDGETDKFQITHWPVVRVFKGDEGSQWKMAKFDPLTDLHKKIDRRDYVLDGTRHAKMLWRSVQGFLLPK